MYGIDDLAEHSALFEMIREAADRQDLPIDTIIKEAAPGQFEGQSETPRRSSARGR